MCVTYLVCSYRGMCVHVHAQFHTCSSNLCTVMYTCCRLVQALYFHLHMYIGTGACDSVSLQDVLSFFSGAAKIPPLGFDPLPSLSFSDNAVYPTASTCALRLTLPTRYSDDYESFKYNMTQALTMHGGFGLL